MNQKNVFLFDGIGALASALFTGIALPLFSDWVGLPALTLYCLALFPLTYGIYSLSCYWIVRQIKPWMLLGIIVANIFYCAISGALVVSYDSLTDLGRALLTAEIFVILGVVVIELKVYRKFFSR